MGPVTGLSDEPAGGITTPGEEPWRFHLVVLGFAAVLGVVLCVHDLTRSLWIDEFGTLWVVEGTFREAWERTLAFQGQSPFYYLLSWLPLQALGESEVALRLPSLLCGSLTLGALYLVGDEVDGPGLGRMCVALGLMSALVIDASRTGRPYALALLMAAITLLGFLRATCGARGGRALFMLGGVGLFYAHYLLASFSVGLGVAYAVRPRLRQHYPVSKFALDLSAQALLAVAGLGHLLALRARSGSLSWITEPSLLLFVIVWSPYLVPIAVGRVVEEPSRARRTREASVVLWIVLVAQILVLAALALVGTRLTAPRYMVTIAIPGIVLAARGVWLTVPAASPRRVAVAVLALMFYAGANVVQRGRLGMVMSEDWRGAVERVEELQAEEPAPVLYRSGFIEDNQRAQGGEVTEAVLSPLRSPGRARPNWEVVPLLADWGGVEGRDAFLELHVVGALERSTVMLVLLRNGPERYFDSLREWLTRRFPARIAVESLVEEGGVTTARIRLLDSP